MRENADRGVWRSVALYAGVFAAALILGMVVLGLWGNLASTPLTYDADGIPSSVGVKSIIENGQPYTNPHLGAPSTAEYYDFPSSDGAFLAEIWLLSRFSHNYVLVLNLFALLTYPLIALAATFSLRRLGVSPPAAVVFALLYALLPFHQSRVTFHLFLSAYFVVPLAIALVADVVLGPSARPAERRFAGLPLWGWGVVLLLGTCGVYYAFFALVLVVLAAVLRWYRQRTWSALVPAASVIAGVVLLLALQYVPSYAYWQRAGRNDTGERRQAIESDFFGLRLTQMVYPMDGHRIGRLAQAKQHLHQAFEMIAPTMANIAYDSSLGVVGVFGLALLGFWMLSAPFRAPPGGLTGVPGRLAFVGVSCFLLGTVGGVGSLVAFLAVPQIRAYDRIVVYIAFASLAAVAWVADSLAARLRGNASTARQALVLAALAAVLVVGALDQTNPAAVGPHYEAIRTPFASDAAFVGDLEDALPSDALVFQLPYVTYPEGPAPEGTGVYDPLRLYLHSSSIHWSAGAFAGREAAAWQAETATVGAREMVKRLQERGFAGVTIDRKGYADGAASLEAGLEAVLGVPATVQSPDGRYAFFPLPGR